VGFLGKIINRVLVVEGGILRKIITVLQEYQDFGERRVCGWRRSCREKASRIGRRVLRVLAYGER
jgi:hypothetical protein